MTKNEVSINGETGTLNYYYCMASAEFLLNYKDIVELNPHYELSPSLSHYNSIPYPQVTNINQKLALKYSIRFSSSTILEGNYTHFHDSQLSTSFQRSNNMLNAALAFQFQKDKRAQLKLSAFDILNQNISVFRTVAGNGIYQGENLIQRRYVLLTYQYKFSKSNKSSSIK